MREQPQQQAPPVQRIRLRYAKRGRLRFTSHRDFSRAFERALVRAQVPMAYSSGFHPHPRISYANAAPTGAASEAEYLEIGLATPVDPAELRATLDAALPPGLDVLEAVESEGGSLADRLQASRWRVEVGGVSADEVRRATALFLDAKEVLVERMTKKGMRTFDTRAAVVRLEADGTLLDLVLVHGVPAVRPDDVVNGLVEVGRLSRPGSALHTRLAQGPLAEDGSIGDPLP